MIRARLLLALAALILAPDAGASTQHFNPKEPRSIFDLASKPKSLAGYKR